VRSNTPSALQPKAAAINCEEAANNVVSDQKERRQLLGD
jgi:hypothetical protein